MSKLEIEDGMLITTEDGLNFAARVVGYGIVGMTKIREISPINRLQDELERARHAEPDQHYQLYPMYVLMDLWEPRK